MRRGGASWAADRQAADSILHLQEGHRYLPGLRAWVAAPRILYTTWA